MNIFKYFRKPYFAFTSGLVFLFFSCTSRELVNNRVFDYSIYDQLKNYSIDESLVNDIIKIKSSYRKSSALEINKSIMKTINKYYHTDINIPDELLSLNNANYDEIKEVGLKKGFLNQKDLDLVNVFAHDIEKKDFDFAISNFEKKVNTLNVNNVEFNKYQSISNQLKAINFKNPNFFKIQKLNKQSKAFKADDGPLACILAIITWIISIVGLVGGCATVFLCALSFFAFGSATVYVVAECVPNTPGEDPPGFGW